jgi:alpha-tubulin suppressor-like RCC1 family protein
MRIAIRPTTLRILTALAALALLAVAAAAPGAHAQAAPAPTAPFLLESVSAGKDHACGLTSGHVAYCWGNNADGELGNPAVTSPCLGGSDPCSPKPVRVATTVLFQAISAGDAFTCAISTAGAPYCWGNNTFGQLGIGSQRSTGRPAKVGIEGVTFQAISAGDTHACAVTTAGAAYCWGSNDGGKLGTGRPGGGHTVPVPVAGRLVFRAISAGYFHTCGLARDGRTYCWGRNDQGEVGNAPRAPSAAPARVALDTAFRDVEAAEQFDYTCGVDSHGGVWCWGANCFNQLGVDSLAEQCGTPAMPCSTKPSPVRLAAAARDVAVAFSHSCALGADGGLQCWGDNNNGQLGNGNAGDRSVTPVAVLGGLTWRALAVGREFTCAITSAGATECWGLDDHGQLGTGDGGNHTRPTPVATP